MVEEMYLEETNKDREAAAAGNDEGNSGGGGNNVEDNGGVHGSSPLELAGDQRQAAHAGLYGDDDDDEDATMQRRLKKARADDQPGTAFHHHHVHDMTALHAQAAAAARQQQHEDQVSHRELLMKFMESGDAGRDQHQHHQDSGYSLFAQAAAPYGQFGSDQPFAFPGNNGGVALTLGLPHDAGGVAADQTASFLMGSSTAGASASHGSGYDMNMQSTKSFSAQLMRDFVA
jgi:hypothetical protein